MNGIPVVAYPDFDFAELKGRDQAKVTAAALEAENLL